MDKQAKAHATEEAAVNNVKLIQRLYITEILKQREEFMLIGLTGRVGSGCSEVASILSSSFTEIGLPPIYPGDMGLANDDERDKRILYRYAAHHWQKFDVIKVRTIITSFLFNDLDSFFNEINSYLEHLGNDGLETKKQFLNLTFEALKNRYVTQENIETIFNDIISIFPKNTISKKYNPDTYISEIKANAAKWEKCPAGKPEFGELPLSEELFKELYKVAENTQYYHIRTKLLEKIDILLNSLSSFAALTWWESQIGELADGCEEKAINTNLEKLALIDDILLSWTKTDNLHFSKYVFVHDILPTLADSIHDIIQKGGNFLFTDLYQKYGNSIRRYGKIIFNDKCEEAESMGAIGHDAFSIPRRINQFVKAMRHPFTRTFAKPTRIVVDSIKSTLEASYLKERYSAFYLIAISAEESVRINRLTRNKNLNLREINFIDWNEYSNHGAEIYQRFLKVKKDLPDTPDVDPLEYVKNKRFFDPDELAFIEKIECKPLGRQKKPVDIVRQKAYTNKLNPFVLQDVCASIQNADIFISNNHDTESKNWDLKWEIVRNISLISHPGLLLPTPIERCMQVAFTAKGNSGCLSRQVGAVVTDSGYNILSIGWNDVPCGDITCSRKNLIDIYNECDVQAYSNYELYNKEFRNRLTEKYTSVVKYSDFNVNSILGGLPWRYCFKDIHADGKQPMRSRAMHAEEKALANIQNSAIGGYLFTTSSPCEMCSKNAKNHKIKKIFYIEPYPGISEAQYSESGAPDNRAEHILFTGAIGRAYMQMYTPIMPHKDILEFLGL